MTVNPSVPRADEDQTTARTSPAKSRLSRNGLGLAVIFVLPAVVLVGALMYYPMIRTFYESLFSTSFLRPTPEFIGLRQYQQLLDTQLFWNVLRNSLVWTFSVVILQNIIGMASAVLLNQNLPARGLTRALILLPWVLPGIVAAILWRFMYHPQLGLINSLLISLDIINERVAWLANPSTAMIAVIIAAVWKGFPFSTIIYLAALQGVDREQMEAAEIDGANAVQRFFRVVIPSIMGIIRLNLLLTTIFTFNYFDMIWVTTRGGPLESTHIFPTIIYEVGFGQFRFGVASAFGVISVLVLVVVALFYLREIRQRGSSG
jgi:multiple sugar transport system permease protein